MTYAVTWSENGGSEYVGKLKLENDCVELLGAAAGRREAKLRLDPREVTEVRLQRSEHARTGPQVLVLVDRSGTEIRLTSVQGLGAVHEIADLIADVCGKAVG